MRLTFALVSFLLVASTASADGLSLYSVSQSGEWGLTCPPVVCSEPGDSWSYSFVTTSVIYGPGAWVSPVTDFQFSLNGILVPSLTGAYIEALWFPEQNDGGFSLQSYYEEPAVVTGPGSASGDPYGGEFIGFGLWDQLFAFPRSDEPPAYFDSTFLPLVPGVYPITDSCLPSPGGCVINDPFEFLAGAVDLKLGPVVITQMPEPSTDGLVLTGLGLLWLFFGCKARRFSVRGTEVS